MRAKNLSSKTIERDLEISSGGGPSDRSLEPGERRSIRGPRRFILVDARAE